VTAFRFLSAGESHGPALGVTIEGVPAGLRLTEDAIAADLARRQKGYGRGARQQIEQDRAEILGGVRHGVTLGSPVMLLVRNRDWENWTRVMQVAPLSDDEARTLAELADGGDKRATPVTRVRPGHADLAGASNMDSTTYATCSSARARARPPARVAAGAVARAFLGEWASRSGRSRPRSAGSRRPPRTARGRGRRPTHRRCAAPIRTPRNG
jgi:chorismate synthase